MLRKRYPLRQNALFPVFDYKTDDMHRRNSVSFQNLAISEEGRSKLQIVSWLLIFIFYIPILDFRKNAFYLLPELEFEPPPEERELLPDELPAEGLLLLTAPELLLPDEYDELLPETDDGLLLLLILLEGVL